MNSNSEKEKKSYKHDGNIWKTNVNWESKQWLLELINCYL
jgi:hypothetical protein